MEKNKHYYWFKLKDDFFAQPYIKKLRKIAGGDTYVIIYQKILLLTIKTNGYLIFQGIEKTLDEELALILDEETDNVRITISFMKSNNLIEPTEDEREYLLPNMLSLIGSESESAKRVRAYRDRKKQGLLPSSQDNKTLQCNDDVTECNKNVTTEIEEEVDKELDKDKRINTEEEDYRSGEKRPTANLTEKSNIIQFNKKTNLLELSDTTLNFLQEAYLDIDISQKLKEMSVWLIAHNDTVTEIEQTDGNFIRFVVKWLNNENNKKKVNKKPTKTYPVSFDPETANLIGMTDDYINILKSKFLGINVDTEIKKMEAWLFNNPSKRPAKDYPRFINRWLAQAQDRASIRNSSQSQFVSKNNQLPPQTFAEKKMQNSLKAVEQVSKEFLKQNN